MDVAIPGSASQTPQKVPPWKWRRCNLGGAATLSGIGTAILIGLLLLVADMEISQGWKLSIVLVPVVFAIVGLITHSYSVDIEGR